MFQCFQCTFRRSLFGFFFAVSAAGAHRRAVEQNLRFKGLGVIRPLFAYHPVDQYLIGLTLHQLLQCGLVIPAAFLHRFFLLRIQQAAVDSTRALLAEKGFSDIAQVYLDSHSHMDQYAQEGSVDCITFNFGYLPGGDHNVFTTPATSIPAIEQGLRLLKPNGLMSLCVYYGGDSGFEEKDALMEYFRTIDSKQYTVLITEFANRPNNPPIPVFILKRI